MARTRKQRARRMASLPKMQLKGDHGTGSLAAIEGTTLEPLKDERGSNPNNMGRRYRKDVYKALSLTMRQEQAAKALRDAYCRVEALSSGGALKERVQSSPKPDATVDMQVAAMSRLVRLTRPILQADRYIIEHILRDNKPTSVLGRKGYARWSERFKLTMDRVADSERY